MKKRLIHCHNPNASKVWECLCKPDLSTVLTNEWWKVSCPKCLEKMAEYINRKTEKAVKVNIPQKGAVRKLAARLKELGDQTPLKAMADKINGDKEGK